MEEKKTTLVLYPGFGVGHLSPMLELSKLLLRHADGATAIDVVIVLVQSPFGDPGFADTVARAKAANTSVTFHILPSPEPLPPPPPSSSSEQHEPQAHNRLAQMLAFLRATNAPLRDFLHHHSLSSSRCALVLDMFCAHALDVAAELSIPAYFLSASGASSLAVFLALPEKRATLGVARFGDLGDAAVLTFAGVPPVTASDLPQPIRNGGAGSKASLGLASRVPEARGILLNSFESLEPRAVQALSDGTCVPAWQAMPPVYCVGPLVSPPDGDKDDGHGGCLRWMDAQPDRSVVFLCFGSLGAFPKRQLDEIAVGLESSGQRFLWVVRSTGDDDLDLAAILPDGFLERTRDRGLVVKNWAPQVGVLRHRAAGAFVTHCGWNSTLEGVTAGLPLLCWPLYAEQRLNKVFLVEEMGLGVEVRKTRVSGEEVVTAEEVEAKVRWVMEDSDGGVARALRERAAAARERAAQALADGGTSHVAFLRFLEDLESGGVQQQRSHG